MPDSIQLLHNYAERRDEQAFGELVHRYLDLIYSTVRILPRVAEAFG